MKADSPEVHYSEQALIAAALAMRLADDETQVRVAAAADRLRDAYKNMALLDEPGAVERHRFYYEGADGVVPAEVWLWASGNNWVAASHREIETWWDGADPEDEAAAPETWAVAIELDPRVIRPGRLVALTRHEARDRALSAMNNPNEGER